MADYVMDASAVLAFLLAEKGADAALAAMPRSCISTVNITEVVTRMIDYGSPDDEAERSVQDLGIEAVNFDSGLALEAARLRRLTTQLGLSTGDRACLATAQQRGWVALTADRAWLKLKLGVRVECIR